jgi:hypothetical protein
MIKNLKNLTTEQKSDILKALITNKIIKKDLSNDSVQLLYELEKPIILMIDEWSSEKRYLINGQEYEKRKFEQIQKLGEALLGNNDIHLIHAPYNEKSTII